MGLLNTGMTWLASVFAGEAISVKYVRNGLSYTLTAFISSQTRLPNLGGESPLSVNSKDRVYSIRVADWTAAGLLQPPEQGDRIEERASNTAMKTVFEVLPTATETAWDFGEPEEVTYLVRAVRTKDASANC